MHAHAIIVTSLIIVLSSWNNYHTASSVEAAGLLGSFGSFANKTKEITNLTVETGKALAKNVPDYVPTFDELLDFTKQSLAGLPFEAAASIINKICKESCFKFNFLAL